MNFRIIKTMVTLTGLLLLASCDLSIFTGTAKTPAAISPSTVTVSAAIVAVPSSLSGDTTVRTLNSDSWVSGSVQSFYAYARDQVKVAARAAISVKTLIEAVEATGLIGQSVNLTKFNSTTQEKYSWKSLGGDAYLLEKWVAAGAAAGEGSKSFELRLTYRLDAEGVTQVAGDFIWNPDAGVVQTAVLKEEVGAQWVKIDFDSAKNGQVWTKVSVQHYRSFKDIGYDNFQNTIIELTRNSLGEVTATGNSVVPGSRHFVWNGYSKADAGDTLNTAAASETRYYLFAGKAKSGDKASVRLAMPTDNYTASTVYSDYAIGAVLKQLFRDRLVKDYDFGGKGQASDLGHAIMANLNTLNTGTGQQLDTVNYENNTPAQVLQALKDAQAKLVSLNQSANDMIDFLVSIMGVENPAYFAASTYLTNGSAAPSGYFAPSELDDLPAISEAAVDGLSLGFLAAAAPTF